VRASNALSARDAGRVVAEVNTGAEYLLGRRTYVGLVPTPKRGEDGANEDAPLIAAEGLKGRAHEYANER
jgi:diphthamide biosynthesis protein 2